MEELRQILMDSVSGGFWNFIGYWIMIGLIVGLPLNFILRLFNRFFRHWNIRIHGYPSKIRRSIILACLLVPSGGLPTPCCLFPID